MTTFKKLFFALLLVMLAGCAEKNGYYEPGQQAVIDKLVSKKWEGDHHAKLDNGEEFDVHEIWIFEDTGKGSYKTITTYENGEEKEILTYFNWTFTTPNFNVIYMDYPKYWLIDKFTENKLCVYETFDDPITVPGQNRRYRELATK